MPLLRLLVLGLLVLCSGPASAAFSPFSRFTLSIEDIIPEPIDVELNGFQLTLPVVEVVEGEGITKEPGTSADTGSVAFILPELDDKIFVALFDWFNTLATGQIDAHPATITGYDGLNQAVATWTLTNAWVSKIVLPAMDAAEPAPYRLSFVLQTDRLTLGTLSPTAPWPEIISVSHDRTHNTFTMIWRSTASATYEVRGWDPVTKEPIVVRSGIVATGTTTPFTTDIVGKGIFYVALTAEPTE